LLLLGVVDTPFILLQGAGPGYRLLALDNYDIMNESYEKGARTY